MNNKKILVIFIAIMIFLIVLFFATKDRNKNKTVDSKTIENKISNFANDNEKMNEIIKDITGEIEKESKKVENSVLDYENVKINKDVNNKAISILFTIYNHSNETIANKTIECVMFDINKKEIGKTNVYIEEMDANDKYNCEITLSGGLTETVDVTLSEIETKGDN